MSATALPPPLLFPHADPDASAARDGQLILRYRRGEAAAFLEIVRLHHRAIFQLAHELLRDAEASDQVTQLVFSRTRRQLARHELPDCLGSWLTYTALRFSRLHYWHNMHPRNPAGPTRATEAPETRLDLKAFARLIARNTGELDLRDRELLGLRHVLGLCPGTIARLLRITEDTAWSRLGEVNGKFAALFRPARTSPEFTELSESASPAPALALSA